MNPVLALYDWLVDGIELDPKLIDRKALAAAALQCEQPADGGEEVPPSPIVDWLRDDEP